jgi:hypothetical protein
LQQLSRLLLPPFPQEPKHSASSLLPRSLVLRSLVPVAARGRAVTVEEVTLTVVATAGTVVASKLHLSRSRAATISPLRPHRRAVTMAVVGAVAVGKAIDLWIKKPAAVKDKGRHDESAARRCLPSEDRYRPSVQNSTPRSTAIGRGTRSWPCCTQCTTLSPTDWSAQSHSADHLSDASQHESASDGSSLDTSIKSELSITTRRYPLRAVAW